MFSAVLLDEPATFTANAGYDSKLAWTFKAKIYKLVVISGQTSAVLGTAAMMKT